MAETKQPRSDNSTDQQRNLNGSITLKRSSSSTSAEGDEFTQKSLYSAIALQRRGSIKAIYSVISTANSLRSQVRKLAAIFESPKSPSNSTKLLPLPPPTRLLAVPPPPLSLPNPKSAPSSVPIRLPGTEDRVVIYTTSLRGIRKTFQDCEMVRMIFKGLRVNLDERDVSMDTSYRKEIQRALGENIITLPQVFVKGKYIGGADTVRQLHEAGELARLIEGLPFSRTTSPCIACDDVRFVPCANCNGSRKVFDEDSERTRRCPECNENGLARCPLCSCDK